MTQAKHAPGPWKTAYHGIDGRHTGMGCGYGESQIIDGKGRAIAGVAAVEPNDGPMYRDGELSQETFDALDANARLIAAAPSLLEALVNLLTDVQNGELATVGQVRQAREAIAKATAA